MDSYTQSPARRASEGDTRAVAWGRSPTCRCGIWQAGGLPHAHVLPSLAAVAVLSLAISAVHAREPDAAELRAAGIRRLDAKHLTLYTDTPSSSAVDDLPRVFDLAVPAWRRYFQLGEEIAPDWHLTGCLMRDKHRFQQTGLLPSDLPEFLNGYSVGREFWFFDQASDYYRRHLMLHEGTHLFMETAFGGAGPPWHFEGMAELLATHRYEQGRLMLNYFPRDRDEVPLWGRIRVIHDAAAAGQTLPLEAILSFDERSHLKVEPYSWCWGAAAFLDGHPRYGKQFRRLCRTSAEPGFNDRCRQLFGNDWPQICEEWQLFAADLEYGYDLQRTAIDFAPGESLATGRRRLTVSADRGWQNTGLRLEPGQKFRITATGRYQVADDLKIWWCEPGGVSICYYHGRPLGMLLAAVRPEPSSTAGAINPFLQPIAVGLGTELAVPEGGTLYLRINDSAAELSDNAGELMVEVTAGT